jgi:DNA-binding MarR family transcriptional regulator
MRNTVVVDGPPALALALLRAANWFDDALRSRLAAGGVSISRSQSHVFAALDPSGSSVAELARRVGVTRQSMHRTVGELVDLGLVQVQPDPVDRRAGVVRLSPTGLEQVRRAVVELSRIESELSGRIGADAVAGLRTALARDWGEPPTSPEASSPPHGAGRRAPRPSPSPG